MPDNMPAEISAGMFFGRACTGQAYTRHEGSEKIMKVYFLY